MGSAYRDAAFEYKKGDTWDRMVHQGVHLLERVRSGQSCSYPWSCEDEIFRSRSFKPLPAGSEFVSYLDAIGRS